MMWGSQLWEIAGALAFVIGLLVTAYFLGK